MADKRVRNVEPRKLKAASVKKAFFTKWPRSMSGSTVLPSKEG
jgi:hypothetical protein